MLVLQLLYPVLPERFRLRTGGLIGRAVGGEEINTDESEDDEVERPTRIEREARTIAWVFGLLTVVFLLGFLAALTIFVFAFVYYYERDLKLAASVTLLNFAVSYVLFVVILQVPFYLGVVF